MLRCARIGRTIFLMRHAAAVIPCIRVFIVCSTHVDLHAMHLNVRGLPFAGPPPMKAGLPPL